MIVRLVGMKPAGRTREARVNRRDLGYDEPTAMDDVAARAARRVAALGSQDPQERSEAYSGLVALGEAAVAY